MHDLQPSTYACTVYRDHYQRFWICRNSAKRFWSICIACNKLSVRWSIILPMDRRPADKCVADVKTSDIYVGIFAWRYGTVPDENNPDKLSITEMEYRAAREKEFLA